MITENTALRINRLETDYIFSQTNNVVITNTTTGIFTKVYNCECKIVDMSDTQYKCSLSIAIKELFGVGITDKITVQPIEVAWFVQNYTAPKTLHAIWTVRGS